MRTPAPDDSYFHVDPAGLAGIAGRFGRDWDEANEAIGDLITAQSSAVADFGDPDVARAWSGFVSAWMADLQITSDALAELVTKTETSAQSYTNADDSVGDSVRRVRAS